MFEAVEGLLVEHEDLEGRLAAPETHADARLAKRLNQRYAELSAIIGTWREWRTLGDDVEAARELGADDPAFAEEAEQLATQRVETEERLRRLLVPRDPADAKDAILEIKSGEGGEESALFAGDLLRMYSRYAEQRGWAVELIDATESDLGGYKSVTLAVKARGTGRARRGAVRAAEVRGRRAPRAAGAGHRVAGPRAHLGRRGAGAARGRAGRRRGRRARPAHRRLPQQRAPAARASTRPTPRCGSRTCPPASWSAARTRRASCRTRSRRCGSCAPACSRPPRSPRTPRRAPRAAARCAPSTAPSGSAPTTTPRTGSPTTAPATSPTTSTRCSTATSARC